MKDPELFEKYLQQELKPGEISAFDQRIKDDPVFAEEFNQYLVIHADMEKWLKAEAEREKLKHTIQKVTTGQRQTKTVVPVRYFLFRAAALLVIAAGLWWIFKPSGKKSNEKLFAAYTTGETLSFERGIHSDSLWVIAANMFYEKKYMEATVPLKQIISNGKDSLQEAVVYLGFCYMQTGDHAAAEKSLLQAVNLKNAVGEKAQWYMALFYLKTGRKDECRKALKEIFSSSAYGNKAARLLKELQ